MKKYGVLFAIIAVFVFGVNVDLYAQQEVIDNLEVVAIKSIQVRDTPNDIYMDVKVNLKNSNDKEIRFRDGKYDFFVGSTYGNEKRSENFFQKEIAFKADGTQCDALIKNKNINKAEAKRGDIADDEINIGTAKKPFFIPEPVIRNKNKSKDSNGPDYIPDPDGCKDVDEIVLMPNGVENLVLFHVVIGGGKQKAFEMIQHMLNCIGNPSVKTPFINIHGYFDLGMRSTKGWTEVEKVKIQWKFVPDIQDKVNFFTADQNQ